MTFRDKFRPIIRAAVADNAGADPRFLRAALCAAWPQNEPRRGWPYKVWLDEIKLQTGRRSPKGRPRRRISSRALRSMNAAEVREWFRKKQLRLPLEGQSSVQ